MEVNGVIVIENEWCLQGCNVVDHDIPDNDKNCVDHEVSFSDLLCQPNARARAMRAASPALAMMRAALASKLAPWVARWK